MESSPDIPLLKAIRDNDEELVLEMLKTEEVDLNAVDKLGDNCFTWACLNGKLPDIALTLLRDPRLSASSINQVHCAGCLVHSPERFLSPAGEQKWIQRAAVRVLESHGRGGSCATERFEAFCRSVEPIKRGMLPFCVSSLPICETRFALRTVSGYGSDMGVLQWNGGCFADSSR